MVFSSFPTQHTKLTTLLGSIQSTIKDNRELLVLSRLALSRCETFVKFSFPVRDQAFETRKHQLEFEPFHARVFMFDNRCNCQQKRFQGLPGGSNEEVYLSKPNLCEVLGAKVCTGVGTLLGVCFGSLLQDRFEGFVPVSVAGSCFVSMYVLGTVPDHSFPTSP